MVGLASEARPCPTFPAFSESYRAVTASPGTECCPGTNGGYSSCLGIGRQHKHARNAMGAQRHPTDFLIGVSTSSSTVTLSAALNGGLPRRRASGFPTLLLIG
jgi:hypothetical protein